jgi:hypothetical protein
VPWKGEKPKGASGVQLAQPMLEHEGLSKGLKPRNRVPSGRSMLRHRKNGGQNGRWVHPAGNGTDTFREEKASKGEIPGALPARNKAGAASEGENRQEGNQTLKAEHSGQAKPASGGPLTPQVL